MYQINNNSSMDLSLIQGILDEFVPFSQKQLGWNKPVSLFLNSDQENANKVLGKTAHYDPQQTSVTVFVDGRHPKDILRSLSHELVHHAQNCRGDLHKVETGEGYAQKDPHMRKMELEAYKKGNIIFRDFEDLIKTGKININFTGEPKMSLKEWRDNELNMLMMKKWGLLQEGQGWGKSPAAFTGTEKEEDDEEEDLKRGKALEERSEERDDDDPLDRPSRRHDNPIKALTAKDYEGIGSKEHDDEEGNRPSFARKMGLDEDTSEGFHPGLAPEVSHAPDCECPDHKRENTTLSIDEARSLAVRIFEKLQNKRK